MTHPSPTALQEIRKRHAERLACAKRAREALQLPEENEIKDPAWADCTALLNHIAALEADLAREEKAHEKSLAERDFAQECLRDTHIALGGDGEWVAKAGQTVQPPHTGDLHYDVPALAAEVRARAEALTEVLIKPISEAPRDGREVVTVYWVNGEQPSQASVARYHRSDISPAYSGWKSYDRSIHATHYLVFKGAKSTPQGAEE